MKRRAYQESDWQQVVDLLHAARSGGYVKRNPTIWRLSNLLTSRIWEPERDVRLWEDAGRLLGFAMVTRRQPESRGIGLERLIDPDADQAALSAEQIEWAEGRAREFAREVGEAVVLSTTPLERNSRDDVRLLESAGFEHLPENVNIYMACSLKRSLETPDLPAGFTIAPLLESEIDAYERLYGFTPLTREHRLDLLRSPEYQHFVAKAPDGEFAAYIECAIDRLEWAQNEQHIGWIDYIGTAEPYQRRGLAKALLAAGFGWLKDAGADEARLITGNDNTAAQNLYTSVGMFMAEREAVYLKTIRSAHLPC